MSTKNPLSRRAFLRLALAGAGGAALAACGAPADEPAPTSVPAPTTAAAPTSAPAPTTAAAPAGDPVELVWWDGLVTQEPWIESEIKLFQEANPTITVKRIKQPNMEDALVAAVGDKSLPDVFLGGPSGGLKAMALEGWLTPLSDFADFEEFKATFPNPAIDFAYGANIFEGKTYAAPFEGRGAMWNLLYMNTDMVKAAGFVDAAGEARVPATLDELLEAVRAVRTNGDGAAYGFATPMSEFLGAFFPWWWGVRSGADFDGTDPQTGKSIYGQNPVFNKIMEFFVLGRDEGWIHPQTASANDEALRALFAEGEIAFIPGGSWNLNGWEQTHPEFKAYRPILPPLIGTTTQKGYYVAGPGGEFLRIGANTKHPEAAWALFKWIHSEAASRRWVESGNGTSIWDANNDASLMGTPAQQEYYEINTANTVVGPYRTEPHDMDSVSYPSAKPDEVATLQGIFSGQLTDIDKALKELGAAKDAAREQAFADAKKTGLSKIGFEYLARGVQFPGWDPAAGVDYVPTVS